MMSRVTLSSLLLALLLGTGIRLWSLGQRDDCGGFAAGEKKLPASVYVASGTRTIVVPCSEWLPRQTITVQLLCLADLVLATLFLLNALHDVRRWVQALRRRRAASGPTG